MNVDESVANGRNCFLLSCEIGWHIVIRFLGFARRSYALSLKQSFALLSVDIGSVDLFRVHHIAVSVFS